MVWDELIPSALDVLAVRPVVLENNRDRAAAYPDLFENAKAAENARRTPSSSYKRPYIGGFGSPLADIKYQRAGAGQKQKAKST